MDDEEVFRDFAGAVDEDEEEGTSPVSPKRGKPPQNQPPKEEEEPSPDAAPL